MNTKVRLVVGNLIDFPAHALVNAIGENLRSSVSAHAVSNAVLKAAGPSLQLEYDDIITQRGGKHLDFGEIVITGPYDLAGKFKTIIAIASAVPDIPALQAGMDRILFSAGYMSYESITMPAFGTGAGKLTMEQFAHIFDDSLLEFSKTVLIDNIKTITIVFSDQASLDAFRKSSQLPSEVFELEN